MIRKGVRSYKHEKVVATKTKVTTMTKSVAMTIVFNYRVIATKIKRTITPKRGAKFCKHENVITMKTETTIMTKKGQWGRFLVVR
jgi:hypothetical protein